MNEEADRSPLLEDTGGLREKVAYKIYALSAVILAISEAVLIFFRVTPNIWTAQIVVLGVSSALFLFGILLAYISIENKNMTISQRLRKSFREDAVVELFFLSIGWMLFFYCPSLAPLRCFRLFRCFWLLVPSQNQKSRTSPPRILNVPTACQRSSEFLNKAACEVFTGTCNGGAVLFFMFFYTVYTVSMCIWKQEENLSEEAALFCDSFSSCFLSVMRLSFFDEDGLDFLCAVIISKNSFVTGLLVFHLVFSPFVLLNGFVGIFGFYFKGIKTQLKKPNQRLRKLRQKKQAQTSAQVSKSYEKRGTPNIFEKFHSEFVESVDAMDKKTPHHSR